MDREEILQWIEEEVLSQIAQGLVRDEDSFSEVCWTLLNRLKIKSLGQRSGFFRTIRKHPQIADLRQEWLRQSWLREGTGLTPSTPVEALPWPDARISNALTRGEEALRTVGDLLNYEFLWTKDGFTRLKGIGKIYLAEVQSMLDWITGQIKYLKSDYRLEFVFPLVALNDVLNVLLIRDGGIVSFSEMKISVCVLAKTDSDSLHQTLAAIQKVPGVTKIAVRDLNWKGG